MAVAGILIIIVGIIGIASGALLAAMGDLSDVLPGFEVFGAIGVASIGLGIVALIGGIVALRRKAWGFALTGAILAIPCSLCLFGGGVVIGILAIIFVAMGRREFA